MSRFQFELATEADDEGLREVLRQTPMGGNVSVTFQREPSYFQAAPTDGPFRQVVVCRETQSRRIVGFGLRAVRRLYVNGEPRDIGYLGSLRLLPEFRNLGLVARGYAYFRKLHEDGRTPLYLTTIAEGNDKAIEVLTSGRAGLPRYHFAGLYHTAVFGMRSIPLRLPSRVPFQSARKEDLPEIVAFLNQEGARRQFFPVLGEEDFFRSDSTFVDLAPEDLYFMRFEAGIAGVIAAWDQVNFKQTVVHRYRGALRWLRPLIDIASWFGLAPPLPRPGKQVRHLTVALPIVPLDSPALFLCSFSLFADHRRNSPHDFLLLGMHERDPLWPHVRELRPRCYTTRLYLVCWEDGEAFRATLDDRVPYLELGCL